MHRLTILLLTHVRRIRSPCISRVEKRPCDRALHAPHGPAARAGHGSRRCRWWCWADGAERLVSPSRIAAPSRARATPHLKRTKAHTETVLHRTRFIISYVAEEDTVGSLTSNKSLCVLSFVGRALLFLKETYLIELCARPRVRAGQPLDARFVFISLVYISKERGRRALQQSELCRAGPEFARAKRCSLSYTYVISSEMQRCSTQRSLINTHRLSIGLHIRPARTRERNRECFKVIDKC